MANTFVINGKAYSRLEEMPPEVRVQWDSLQDVFADADRNGLPDLPDIMGIMDTQGVSGATMIRSNAILYNGKVYGSVEELPPEGRAAFETAIGQSAVESTAGDGTKDGMPDALQNSSNAAPTRVTMQMSTAPAYPALPPATSINLGPIIVIAIVCIGLVIIVGILLFLVLNKT